MVADDTEKSTEDLPPQILEDRNAVFLGVVTSGPPIEGLVAIYFHDRSELIIGEWSDEEFGPALTVEAGSRLITDNLVELIRTVESIRLTEVGKGLHRAYHYAELTPLSAKQAMVYSLLEDQGLNQEETAAALNLSKSTIRTHYNRARERIQQAQTLTRVTSKDQSVYDDMKVIQESEKDEPIDISEKDKPIDILNIVNENKMLPKYTEYL